MKSRTAETRVYIPGYFNPQHSVIPDFTIPTSDPLGCENEENISSEEDWISEIVHEVASNNYQLQVTPRRKNILEEEIAKDKTLQRLVQYYMKGCLPIVKMYLVKFMNKNIKEPLLPYPVPSRPYQRVGMDFFQLGNYSYLIIVVYLLAWFDVVKVPYKTASETIKSIKPIFATHGITNEIVADNMPFSSFEFEQFCQGLEIKLTNTSPHYPQSNGMVEKAVGLSESTAQVMMRRQLRTVLPTIEENLLPNVVRVKEDKELKQKRSKLYYYKTSQQR
ncbi:unnamed protein product, partial [Brenthis ino]